MTQGEVEATFNAPSAVLIWGRPKISWVVTLVPMCTFVRVLNGYLRWNSGLDWILGVGYALALVGLNEFCR